MIDNYILFYLIFFVFIMYVLHVLSKVFDFKDIFREFYKRRKK